MISSQIPFSSARPPAGPPENIWLRAVRANPRHAADYAARWQRLAAEGEDVVGEARLVDAMAERGSRILDAGCGQGRIGAYLAAAGHHVTGVDLDPELIAHARTACPDARWETANLAELDLGEQFDLIVCAGNVMTFLAGSERAPALRAVAVHLAEQGRFVVGFGTCRGWTAEDFIADAEAVGLRLQQRFATWTLQPCGTDPAGTSDDFFVGVFTR